MISEESIREVRERTSITEIISDSVVLKRQGRSLTGLCPFHSERSPSFHVHEDDGYYHCFGCGASGNVISFVMTSRGLSFPEAIEYLAERYGIELKKDNAVKTRRGTDWSREIFLANRMALEFYQKSLKVAPPEVRKYVSERGLSEQMVSEFMIGYAGKERTALADFLTRNGVSQERQIQAGLVRRNERGDVYDTFRARLIFPIALDSRRVAAFGGRIIPTLVDAETLSRAPKYLNSPESQVYEKRKTLFGLPQAIRGMREQGCVYIVEGYMDVVSLSQTGVSEVVATCGTALTEDHLRRLSRLTKRVILLFDGDSAGRQAAGRTFAIALNAEIDIYALFLPAEDDPDTIARKHGAKTREYLSSLEKVSLLDCFLSMMMREYQVEKFSELGAASIEKISLEMVKLLKQVKRPLLRERMIEEAAFRLRVKPETLTAMIGGVAPEKSPEPSRTEETQERAAQPRENTPAGPLSRLDRDLLAAVMVLREKVCAELLHDAVLCESVHPSVIRFATAFREILVDRNLDDDSRKARTRELLQSFGPDWITQWKRAHEMGESTGSDLNRVFRECAQMVRLRRIDSQIKDLRIRIGETTDEYERLKLNQDLLLLERERRERSKG